MSWDQADGDLIESAWGIIANAGGGNWETQTPEWVEAAEAWRDRYQGWHQVIAEHVLPDQGVGYYDGDCCDGNYDDAHKHGIKIGEGIAAERARQAVGDSDA